MATTMTSTYNLRSRVRVPPPVQGESLTNISRDAKRVDGVVSDTEVYRTPGRGSLSYRDIVAGLSADEQREV